MERKLFTDLVQSDSGKRKTKSGLFLPVSIGLHVAALLAAIIVPLLEAQPLPEPAGAVKAFFADPVAAPPPPPPPPPPAPKQVQKVEIKPIPQDVPKFVAPVEVPDEIKPTSTLDVGVEGGAAGGVEGGVAGGVAGGIVGGLPAEPPPPPPVQAVRVGGNIKEPTKTKNVAPTYPDIAKQARVSGVVILECTISPQGRVSDVKVLRGIPLLDQAAIDAVKQWQYTPTLLNGVPVPVIMTVTVNFKLN